MSEHHCKRGDGGLPCGRWTGPGDPWGKGNCRDCFLFASHPEYNARWGGTGVTVLVVAPPAPAPPPRPVGLPLAATSAPTDVRRPCRHRGGPTGETVRCPSCSGHVELKLFACSVHGRCTLARQAPGTACCATCPDHEPEPAPSPAGPPCPAAGDIRHLAYFVYPLRGSSWRWNCSMLRARLSLFNGERLVAVATDGGTDSLGEVRRELPGCELLEVANDPVLREMAAYPLLLERLSRHAGPADVHFYGHAKGVTSEGWADGVREWSEAMYELNLDYWPHVRRLLASYPTVGAFKRLGYHFDAKESLAPWHFSGSFRWTRNADLFARDWRTVDRCWVGSESHPGLLFRAEEAACLAGEFSEPGLPLYYSGQGWDRWARRAAWDFRRERLPDRWAPLLLTCVLTSHAKPGYVHEAIASVLAQDTPDWQLIVMDSGPLLDAGAFSRYEGDPRIALAATGETPDMRGKVCLQSRAINECFRRGLIRGDLVCYLSDDDVYLPHAFSTWLAAARSRPGQSAWFGQAERVDAGPGGERALSILDTADGGPFNGKIDGIQVCHRAAAACPWPEDPTLASGADGFFLDALAAKVHVHRLPTVLARHRHTPVSTFTRSSVA